ncbi:MAG: tripartite tricarboxylate transporter TctB family protein [Anaerolineae bacterium]|nr:tripartite tricarboxylate transporter TctB family protein [Anaerolineae bacterium]
MSSSSASVREPHVQSQRSQSYSARPQHRRLIASVQMLFFFFGLLFLIMGSLRVALENYGNLKTFIDKLAVQNIASVPTLVVGILMALLGYGLLWGIAALGAKEPPGWHAGRNGLLGIILMLMTLMAVTAWLNISWLIFMVPVTVIFSSVAMFLFLSFNQPSVRLVLGADRLQKRETAGFRWVRNGFIVLILSTMAVLAGVYAVLTDIIELPLQETKPGEFIFVTTFDNYNDEWDIYPGRDSSEIVTDEHNNPHLVVKLGSGQPEDGVYSLLNRKIRDFDLRVTTNQLTSDALYDNRYGVIFRYRDNFNYYSFEVSGDGWYRVIKVEEGVEDGEKVAVVTEVSAWMSTTLINNETVIQGLDAWIAGANIDDQKLREIISTWVTTSSTELSDEMIQRIGTWLTPADSNTIDQVRTWLADPETKLGYNSEDEISMIQGWIDLSEVSDNHFLSFPTLIRPGRYNLIDNRIDTVNEIRVVGYEDKFWFYVNGQRLKLCQRGDNRESTFSGGVCISDELTDYYQDDAFKQGKIGFSVGNTGNSDLTILVTIAFDNVVIVGPDPDTMNVSEEPNVSENPN